MAPPGALAPLNSNPVRIPEGRAKAGRLRDCARALLMMPGAPSRAAPVRAQGAGQPPLVLLVPAPRRVPAAPFMASWVPGTAHPALSRPLLRTLTLPAVARQGDDELLPHRPAPPWSPQAHGR